MPPGRPRRPQKYRMTTLHNAPSSCTARAGARTGTISTIGCRRSATCSGERPAARRKARATPREADEVEVSDTLAGTLRRWFPRPRRRLERHELTWLIGGLVICSLVYAFIALAGEVVDGDTRALDAAVLQALRKADNPSAPIGPAWLATALLDITALGGPTVVWLVVTTVIGFLCLQARYRTALMVAAAAGSGEILNQLLKLLFMRPRPSIVPHLRDATTASFPSGHAMES